MEHLNKVEVTIHYTKGEIVLLIACIGWEHTEILVKSLIMLCQVKVNIVLEDDCRAEREHAKIGVMQELNIHYQCLS